MPRSAAARAIRDDAQLRHAELVVRVEVDHEAAGLELLAHLRSLASTSLSQSEPRTENSTGKPRCAVKPALRQILHDGAQARDTS